MLRVSGKQGFVSAKRLLSKNSNIELVLEHIELLVLINEK